MPQKEKSVVLACRYGVGAGAKQPGEVVTLPENDANRLIKSGYAKEPHVVSASSSEMDDLKEKLKEAQKSEKAAKKAATEAEKAKTEAEAKLGEAVTYAKTLEELCKSNKIELPE